MFIKITASEVEGLKKGDTVARYPMVGKASNTIAMDDERQVHLMEVRKITGHHIDLGLSAPAGRDEGHTVVDAFPLSKRKEDIVRDSRWWVSV